MFGKSASYPDPEDALPGRAEPLIISGQHFVLKRPMIEPFPDDCEQIQFGMGCFWGAEKIFWELEGVFSTAVGYAAGLTPNPSYQEVCSGLTGHNEVVLVIYQPSLISLDQLLITFWQSHDPTQGMAQGNDRGTQYRSGIYCYSAEQQQAAQESRDRYQQALNQQAYPAITTEIQQQHSFYYAEEYHQQYLAKNPDGYCGLGGTGVSCS